MRALWSNQHTPLWSFFTELGEGHLCLRVLFLEEPEHLLQFAEYQPLLMLLPVDSNKILFSRHFASELEKAERRAVTAIINCHL